MSVLLSIKQANRYKTFLGSNQYWNQYWARRVLVQCCCFLYIHREHPKAEPFVIPEKPGIEPALIALILYTIQLRYHALTPVGNKMYCTLSAQANWITQMLASKLQINKKL